MNSFGTRVMRSVDEVFGLVLLEPNPASDSPQGCSPSLTVGLQLESPNKSNPNICQGFAATAAPDVRMCSAEIYRGK